jgi:hypothetical protein
MQVRNWEKSGFTVPHLAGTAEPTGAAGPAGAAELLGADGPASATEPPGAGGPAGATGPAPCHVSSPGDHHSHK